MVGKSECDVDEINDKNEHEVEVKGKHDTQEHAQTRGDENMISDLYLELSYPVPDFHYHVRKFLSFIVAMGLLWSACHVDEDNIAVKVICIFQAMLGIVGFVVLCRPSTKYKAVKTYALVLLGLYMASIIVQILDDETILTKCRFDGCSEFKWNMLFRNLIEAVYAMFAFAVTWKYAVSAIAYEIKLEEYKLALGELEGIEVTPPPLEV